jgi:8-oxo-dGTP pyrophosphatase MutT (NUDIX family)
MKPVLAGGFVLYRAADDGPRFLLLHNAKHGTWGFPKGHAEPGESIADCARREVAEETGGLAFDQVPGFCEVVGYRVPEASGGYPKEVHYFLGELRDSPGDTAMQVSGEHSEARWVLADEAMALLEHAASRNVLTAALEHLASGD